jgi:hypothetical protein
LVLLSRDQLPVVKVTKHKKAHMLCIQVFNLYVNIFVKSIKLTWIYREMEDVSKYLINA